MLVVSLLLILPVLVTLVVLAVSLAMALAVAAAMLAASLVATVINTWYSGKMLRYGLLQQATDQVQTVAAMTLAALPAWGILHWMPPGGLLPTFGAILVAAVIYIGAALLFRHPALQELHGLMKNMLSPGDRSPSDTVG